MKACVATGEKRVLTCKEIPVPEVEPGWLLLKTIYACICGSDLEYLDGSFNNIDQGFGYIRPGSIPGHEFIAEVVEVGDGAEGWSVGDRVVPLGNPDPAGIGSPNPGYENYRCMAEYFLSTPSGVQKVPDHVSDEEAVFVEPLCTGNGAAASAGVKPGQSAVVFGAGKIGLLAAMSARVAGASPVIIVDMVESRLQKALQVGVDVALNPKQADVTSEVVKLTNGGPDSVLICVRDGMVLNQSAQMVKRGGRIVLAGFVSPMEVNPMLWTVKQLKIIGILGGSMVDSLHMISRKQVDPTPLITETTSFDDCQRAIDSVYSGENIAVLLSA